MRCPRCARRLTPGKCRWPTPSAWPTRPGAPTLRQWTPLLICWPWPTSCPPDRFAREAGAWAQRHQSRTTVTTTGSTSAAAGISRPGSNKTAWSASTACWTPRPAPASATASQDTAEELCRQDQQTARTRGAATRGGGPADSDSPGESESGRSWDQLRADALDLLTSGADGNRERGGSGGRPKAEVIVVADIGALTGDDPAGRCEIPGGGPVPRAVLERIACDAQLTGLLFSDGKPLHHGATVRTATTAQWRMLIARDGGCIGCGAEPGQCQAHHITPYARLRRTDIENLVLVCWRCHHNIHDHHWQVVHRQRQTRPATTRPARPTRPRRRPTPPRPTPPRILDDHDRAAAQQPSRGPQPARARAQPAPTRPGSAHPANGPDPPLQTASALFPA